MNKREGLNEEKTDEKRRRKNNDTAAVLTITPVQASFRKKAEKRPTIKNSTRLVRILFSGEKN
ncbi:hypothetical protein EWH99_11220 [Sporolactobacillus sp. THM7-7]|nr:hypothetical protein EWH99_11220 [Sporolactobacillus sp. THM7-7]